MGQDIQGSRPGSRNSLRRYGYYPERIDALRSRISRVAIKRWVLNAILVAASLCVAIVIAELVLRLIGYSHPFFWSYDDVTGIKLRAGVEGWQHVEGDAYVMVNSDGMRDREHTKTKPPNTLRIAVLGDSLTEAVHVPMKATFTSILEEQLRKCGPVSGRTIEVLNFGVAGFGTAQELLTLRHRAWAYAPDIVVLAFFSGNDVRNNSRELEPMKLRPFFNLENGGLVLDNSFLNDPEYLHFKANIDWKGRLLDLRTYQLARDARTAIVELLHRQPGSGRGVRNESGLDDEVFLPPPTKAWSDAWDISERLIVKARDEVVEKGSRFLLVSIPLGIQTNKDAKVRSQFMRDLGVQDLFYPERRLRALAQKERMDIVILAPLMQAYAEQHQVYTHGFHPPGSGHLNQNGHKLVGELIAEHLCEADTPVAAFEQASVRARKLSFRARP